MKKVCIAVLLTAALLFTSVGCNSPKYRFAEYALRTGINNDDKVVDDFSNLVQQASLDYAGEKIELSVKTGDVAAAKQAVLNFANVWDTSFNLKLAHERNRQLNMMGLQYIWESQGILNVLYNDWHDASVKAQQDQSAQGGATPTPAPAVDTPQKPVAKPIVRPTAPPPQRVFTPAAPTK